MKTCACARTHARTVNLQGCKCPLAPPFPATNAREQRTREAVGVTHSCCLRGICLIWRMLSERASDPSVTATASPSLGLRVESCAEWNGRALGRRRCSPVSCHTLLQPRLCARLEDQMRVPAHTSSSLHAGPTAANEENGASALLGKAVCGLASPKSRSQECLAQIISRLRCMAHWAR